MFCVPTTCQATSPLCHQISPFFHPRPPLGGEERCEVIVQKALGPGRGFAPLTLPESPLKPRGQGAAAGAASREPSETRGETGPVSGAGWSCWGGSRLWASFGPAAPSPYPGAASPGAGGSSEGGGARRAQDVPERGGPGPQLSPRGTAALGAERGWRGRWGGDAERSGAVGAHRRAGAGRGGPGPLCSAGGGGAPPHRFVRPAGGSRSNRSAVSGAGVLRDEAGPWGRGRRVGKDRCPGRREPQAWAGAAGKRDRGLEVSDSGGSWTGGPRGAGVGSTGALRRLGLRAGFPGWQGSVGRRSRMGRGPSAPGWDACCCAPGQGKPGVSGRAEGTGSPTHGDWGRQE